MENPIPENGLEDQTEKTSRENYISWFVQTFQGGAEETEKPLHMRWFKFWTYVWLPLHIILYFPYPLDSTNPVIWNTYFGLLAIIYVPTIIGLHKKKKWGWKLNLAVITGHTFIVMFVYYYTKRYMDMWGLYRDNPPDSFTLIAWLIWIIVWLLFYVAQYLYWKRREHLFT